MSTCGFASVAASVRPALTIASSSGFKANTLIFLPSRSPSAYKVFWSSVSSFGGAEAAGPEVCAHAIIEEKQKENVRKWIVFFIIEIRIPCSDRFRKRGKHLSVGGSETFRFFHQRLPAFSCRNRASATCNWG